MLGMFIAGMTLILHATPGHVLEPMESSRLESQFGPFDYALLTEYGVEDNAISSEEAWALSLEEGVDPTRITYLNLRLCDEYGDGSEMTPAWKFTYIDDLDVESNVYLHVVTGEPIMPGWLGGPQIETCGASNVNDLYDFPIPSSAGYFTTTYCKGDWLGDRYATENHHGWDFNQSDDLGDPIEAVKGGRIAYVQNNCDHCTTGWGNYVKIEQEDGLVGIYAHMETVAVKTGWTIDKGRVLGYIGSTGWATGPHLHFETQKGGIPVNPKFQWVASGGSNQNGYLSDDGKERRSRNEKTFYNARLNNGGQASVGSAVGSLATPMGNRGGGNPWGYKRLYQGGSYGECAIYHETNGCDGGDYCPSYSNEGYAYLVRTGFYEKYRALGETESRLGFPRTDEYRDGRGITVQRFRYGWMEWRDNQAYVYYNN